MRLIIPIVLVSTLIAVSRAEDANNVASPIKIDKNLRRALLRALEDLEAESAEQRDEGSTADQSDSSLTTATTESSTTQSIDRFKGASITFDEFPGDNEEIPSEDKLQNSTFVETDKYIASDSNVLSAPSKAVFEPEKVVFQKFEPLLSTKKMMNKISDANQAELIETRGVISSRSHANAIVDNAKAPKRAQEEEHLTLSSSNGIVPVSANSLPSPVPTVSSLTGRSEPKKNLTALLPTLPPTGRKDSEVKIFQAPLVAAFTVQQDERGVPKSVVPIYKNKDGQALSLQEQLDFKQQLLERQLAELQAQQIQQTQFLIRQQQLYQEQQRQKQRQQFFLQEQARFSQKQQALQSQHQLPFQQQLPLQQPLGAFSQNNLQTLQLPLKSSVQFQPSVNFQLPSAVAPPVFQSNPQPEHLRFQHQRQQQLLQQQQQPRQQALQQSFPTFDFHPPVQSPPLRFNRQEAESSVGNLGVNDGRFTNNQVSFEPPRPSFIPFNQFNQFSGFRSQTQRLPTPANQIQHLLFQSGVAGELGNQQTNGNNQEDLNIVSKVLALNVGAIPPSGFKFNNEVIARV